MWTLIVTLAAFHVYGGNSIHSVSGFQTKEACTAAAAAWLESHKAARVGGTPSAICVARG